MKFALLLLTLALIACSGKQWSASHPYYRETPSANDEIAMLGLHNTVVVSRDKWFAKRLGIPRDSVYPILGTQIEESFAGEIQSLRYPKLVLWPDSIYSNLPEETQKLDERIYIKGHFPAQGKPLSYPAGNTPKRLLLIHECTFGLDLKKDEFYDYALTGNEAAEKKNAENLTIILAYTLWDNEKQRALYSAVAEIPLDISAGIQASDIAKVSAFAADSLIAGIDGGIR